MRNDNRIRKRNRVSIDVRSLKSASVYNTNPFWFYYPLMHLWCVIFLLLLLLLLLFDPSLRAASLSSSSSPSPCSSAGAVAHSRCFAGDCVRMAIFFQRNDKSSHHQTPRERQRATNKERKKSELKINTKGPAPSNLLNIKCKITPPN